MSLKKNLVALTLANLLAIPALSCGSRNPSQLNIDIWNGGDNEITRKVKVNGEDFLEYLLTHDPNFKDYRCLTKEHMKLLVDRAIQCGG